MTHWETSLRLASTGMFRGWASSWLPSTCVSSLCSASSVCAKLRSIQNNNTHWTLFHIGVNAGDMVYISWIKLNLVHLFFFNMTQFDLTYLPGETVGYTSECECQRHCWQEELPPSLCSRCACCKYLPWIHPFYWDVNISGSLTLHLNINMFQEMVKIHIFWYAISYGENISRSTIVDLVNQCSLVQGMVEERQWRFFSTQELMSMQEMMVTNTKSDLNIHARDGGDYNSGKFVGGSQWQEFQAFVQG